MAALVAVVKAMPARALLHQIHGADAQDHRACGAAAHVAQADVLACIAGTALLPGIATGIEACWQGSVDDCALSTDRGDAASLSTPYKNDFWSRHGASHDAALHRSRASRFDHDTVRIGLVTDVAVIWLQAVAASECGDIARRGPGARHARAGTD